MLGNCWLDVRKDVQRFSSGKSGGRKLREPTNSGSPGKWPLKRMW